MPGTLVGIILLAILAVLVVASLATIIQPGEEGAARYRPRHRGRRHSWRHRGRSAASLRHALSWLSRIPAFKALSPSRYSPLARRPSFSMIVAHRRPFCLWGALSASP